MCDSVGSADSGRLKKIYRIVLWLTVILGCSGGRGAHSAEFRQLTWEQLDESIVREVGESYLPMLTSEDPREIKGVMDRSLRESSITKAIFDTGNETLWRAMLSQGDKRGVVLAGVHCLSRKDSDRSAYYSLIGAISGESMGFEKEYFHAVLKSSNWDHVSPNLVADAVFGSTVNPSKVPLYIDTVPLVLLSKAIDETDVCNADQAVLATVVMHIFDESTAKHTPLSPGLKKLISDSADVPGDLRMMFCYCAESDDRRLPGALVSLLNTPASSFRQTSTFNNTPPLGDDDVHSTVHLIARNRKALISERKAQFEKEVTTRPGKYILQKVLESK